jgi:ankyrin repeat protein
LNALLKAGASVNSAQNDGATALHWAAHWNDTEMVKILLAAGARANAADKGGVTPLSLASINANPLIVQALLDAGANANARQSNGETALMTAARTGSTEVIGLLLARGSDINSKEDSRGQSALMWAAAEHHADVVRVLIEKGAEVNARSRSGFTALLFAVQQGDLASARVLLDSGADVNDAAPEGPGGDTNGVRPARANAKASALVIAVDSNQEAMARLLLDRGADPNHHGAGHTALHSAVQRAMPELVKALLARGADPNARLEDAMPALSRLILQQNGMEIDQRGATPFWLAADYGDVEMMRILVAAGANPRLTTNDSTTALMAAAGVDFIEGQDRYGRRWFQDTTMPLQLRALECARLALDLGADVNTANVNGQTALHGAAYMGSNLVTQFLFDHGAKLNPRNKRGQTPYFITQGTYQAGSFIVRKETGELLRKLGADTSLDGGQ